MKLIRFGAPGAEKPGLILGDGARLDAPAFGSDWDERFLGSDGLLRLEAWAREQAAKLLEPKAVRVRPKSTTLHDEAEVDLYLTKLRSEILGYLKDGSPVII